MTKKEQKHVDELTQRLRIQGALRWTEPVAPDMPIPDWGEGIVNGYHFNASSARVERACSSSVSHNFGNWDRTTTQQSMRLYSTRLLAFKALRSAVERECAEKLAKIDLAIEAEAKAGD